MIINDKWEIVCGIEVHCQIISESKIFSPSSTQYGAEANSHVSFIDAGMPGMLPTLNAKCVEQAVKTGLGLNAKINLYSEFARKNYFYADLPQGYQISQFKFPIVGEGSLDIGTKKIRIERLHIEQDAGKSIHDISPDKSYIDLNRAGVGLMEIVTHPDFSTPEEVGEFIRRLRSMLRYIETCDGNMDEGSMRCDVNVSIRPIGSTELRTRCEMKNMNSVKFVMQAIEAEAKRQAEIYENGGTVAQETRSFDPQTQVTKALRSKEFAHDYRYFPEPDLPPLVLTQEYVDGIKNNMPELPEAKKARFVGLGLTEYDAMVLCDDKETAKFFEDAIVGSDAKKVANWIMGDFFGFLKKDGLLLSQSPVSPKQIGELVNLINDGVLNSKIAKEVFEIMWETSQNPSVIVEEKGLKQETNLSEIEAFIDELIANNPDNVNAYKSGRNNLLGWFVGQTLKFSKGKANPAIVSDLIVKKLS
ncbi:MAG: Asp-tRNA(Asn)/Glu-tRNA(Gln) amidotransferase subunit GatB [Alphaproteobacteria bacterium]